MIISRLHVAETPAGKPIHMQVPSIIGLYSSAPQSGKSTVAKYLEENFGYTIVRFADPVKAMTAVFLSACGFSDEAVAECVNGSRKEEPILHFSGEMVSPRRLMQTIGTDWGRNAIHPDVWVEVARCRVRELVSQGMPVVIDDMRFPNEHAMVNDLEGVCIRVQRAAAMEGYAKDHPSEGNLDFAPFIEVVVNDSDIPALHARIDDVLSDSAHW